jgi:hypothetical protein
MRVKLKNQEESKGKTAAITKIVASDQFYSG